MAVSAAVEPRLMVLGAGDSEAIDRWNSNYLVEANGRRMLIDCGPSIKFALRDQGLSLEDIDAVFITHVHGDHVHGLERVGYESRYSYHKRTQLIFHPSLYQELWDGCLRGTMGSSGDGGNTLDSFFEVSLVENEHFEFAGVEFRLFPTPHAPNKPSFGVVINDRLILTSDTNPIDWLAADVSGRTIIHDCSLQDYNPVHATVSELLEHYPADLRQRMWATHYGDQIEAFRPLLERELAGVVHQGQVFAL